MSCCPPNEIASKSTKQHDQFAEELRDMASDPTLQSCCKRDLEDQAKTASLKAKLSLTDRSEIRQRLAAGVIKPPKNTPSIAINEAAGSDDAELERLRTLRLNELRAQAAKPSTTGQLTTILESKASTSLQRPNVVVHLALEGSPVCDTVDECLSDLAYTYQQLLFLRCVVRPITSLHHSLNMPPGPGLACSTSDKNITIASLAVFGAPDDFREERLQRWIRRQLIHDTNTEEESASDDDSELAPCVVCGRTYPHEHMRTVFGATHDDDGSDEDYSD